jgi:phospholipase/carboxylesterase
MERGVAVAAAGALACGCVLGAAIHERSQLPTLGPLPPAGAAASAPPPGPTDAEVEEDVCENNLIVSEPTGAHEVTIILLPGFTGSADTLLPWFKRIEECGVSLENVRVVATTAPKRRITCYDGWRANAWFDYIDEQFDKEDIIDEAQLAQSRQAATKLVSTEIEKLGGDQSKVLLLGFSQGGNMAYDVALSYPSQLGGLIARRTSLRNESDLGSHKGLPILHFHGEEDDSIGCNRGKAGVARLQAAGFTNCKLHTEPGLNHTEFSEKEMGMYAEFVLSLFPQLKQELPSELKGFCYCGAVHYSVRGGACGVPACFCHCESCRRSHAAPLYQVCYVPVEDFTITAGSEHIKAHKFRHFCGECGSKIFNEVAGPQGPRRGFFPSTLEEATQHKLPGRFRPTFHNLSNEAVLHDLPKDALPRNVAEEV